MCRYTDLMPQDEVTQVEPSESALTISEEEEDEGYNSKELRSDVEFEKDDRVKKHKRV